MKRLLVNDCLTAIQGTRTFWHDLQEWFDMEFVGVDADQNYSHLAVKADAVAGIIDQLEDGEVIETQLIIRNASWFGPLKASERIPTISLLQDIFEEGPQREMQEAVMETSKIVAFNSEFTKERYLRTKRPFVAKSPIVPLPVDFTLFEPGNAMGLQQALSLPDGCICWIGASQGAAGQVKGHDIFLSIVRQNPDLHFVAVFKDAAPEYGPPNMRTFTRLPHEELVKVIGACRVGLCTSRVESQHLAGIEMGACGLPLVAPAVGAYWKREDMPGVVVDETTPTAYASAIRAALGNLGDPQSTRAYWEREFSKAVVREEWEALVKEVEQSNASFEAQYMNKPKKAEK